MHILFLHKNFPAQFGQIATHLARHDGYRCTYVSEKDLPDSAEIQQIQYHPESAAQQTTHYYSRTFESQTWRSDAVYQTLASRKDVQPDLIVAHSGFVSPLFLRELYPNVPQIGYFEYFYRARQSDMDFRSDLPLPPTRDFQRVRARNAQLLLDLHNCDRGYAPTEFQRSQLPVEFQSKISTIFDGIDTQFWRPGLEGVRQFGPITIPDDHRIVTYVSRGFEAMRGFDIFLRVADQICRQRSNVSVIVVGEDRIAYGGDARFTDGKSFKQWAIDKYQPDLSRIHFVGRLPPSQLARLLANSDLHLYLTVPFVLSWSLMNSLSCRCKVVASNTGPVQEMIRDGQNGLLADFFDVDGFVQRSLDVLDHPAKYEPLGNAAREGIQSQYSLDISTKKLRQLYQSVVSQEVDSDADTGETTSTRQELRSDTSESWEPQKLHVNLGDRWYEIQYPYSPSTKILLNTIFQGREYPICLPADLKVETIVDIGAGVGAAAIWFHHHYPEARVISYEPSPSSFQMLEENTASIDQIETHPFALLDCNSQSKLYRGKYHAFQNSLIENPEASKSTESITVRAASDEMQRLNLPRISILKLDTEGCERRILTDIQSWLPRVDAIYLEYHCEQDRRDIDQLLAPNFYLVRALVRRANLGSQIYLARSIANRHREFVSPPLRN